MPTQLIQVDLSEAELLRHMRDPGASRGIRGLASDRRPASGNGTRIGHDVLEFVSQGAIPASLTVHKMHAAIEFIVRLVT